MATIVQDYGPIYGEVVNGTVQGRPNGSVYVPISNTVSLSLVEARRYIIRSGSYIRWCNSSGQLNSSNPALNPNVVAVAQDLASNIRLCVYTDSDCTALAFAANKSAGQFNGWYNGVQDPFVIVNETTYYMRAQLMNNDVAIATSDVIEVVGVVTE